MGDEGRSLVTSGVEAFLEAAGEMGVGHGPGVAGTVEAWFHYYESWPGRRVVGFSDVRDIAVKLIADSFAIERAIDCPYTDEGMRAIDLGSGNGWPGLAVKALRPRAQLALLDSRLGACRFLEGFVEYAGLRDVEIVPWRAEKAAKQAEYSGKYDLVTTRAMARPGVSLELSVPFCRQQGKVALWLGPEDAAQIGQKTEIPELGVRLGDVHEYVLAGGKGRRLLAVYTRTGDLARGFPRSLSAIKARPLF
jgi:16S rRNA (guanine527-N7)-methyltransferase